MTTKNEKGIRYPFFVRKFENEKGKNGIYTDLNGIPRTDKLLLMGDFNARIGIGNDKWPLVMGKHVIGKCNSNGELLLSLCSEFELIVTNTMFKQNDELKTTWMHPRSGHWHMIDFITMRIIWTSTIPEPCLELTDDVKFGIENTTKAQQARDK